MTIWHWVRHGPTHEKNFVGWRDVPADLSDAPRLARLNLHLPDDALLVSSDLMRAVHTADALALPSRRRLPHEQGLRELHFGAWDGLAAPAAAAVLACSGAVAGAGAAAGASCPGVGGAGTRPVAPSVVVCGASVRVGAGGLAGSAVALSRR